VGVPGTSVGVASACVATGVLEPHAVVVIRIIVNITNKDFIIFLRMSFSSAIFDYKNGLLMGEKMIN
jgi:hypothetical protein